MKVELRELQNRVAEAQEAAEGASQQATLALAAPGQSAKLAANGCCGSMMNPKIMNMALLD
jgi:hypothetical protein